MTFKGWDKVAIQVNNEPYTAIAPIIISASRSTDIPAFHTDWFFNRLHAGYVKWINPFNQKAQYISFSKARVIVFWTKNAQPMIPYLYKLDYRNINYYFTFTINDYEKENLEPNVPPLQQRINTFKELSRIIGKDRVIWRFDPLILTDHITTELLLKKIAHIGRQLKNYTNKLVISFADIECYVKAKRNLKMKAIHYRNFTDEDKKEIAHGLHKLNQDFQFEITTCAETINLTGYGISKNRCIDDQLMIRLFPKDQVLMNFLQHSPPQPDLSSSLKSPLKMPPLTMKDKGQRQACGCIASKDIGQYNTCMHLCTYCYANTSESAVRKNYGRLHGYDSETIIP